MWGLLPLTTLLLFSSFTATLSEEKQDVGNGTIVRARLEVGEGWHLSLLNMQFVFFTTPFDRVRANSIVIHASGLFVVPSRFTVFKQKFFQPLKGEHYKLEDLSHGRDLQCST